MSMSTDAELLSIANATGFPLQIALQNAVEANCPDWRVHHREHAWRNLEDGRSGFIDVVLEHKSTSDSVVVECKRVRESCWLFLGHSGRDTPRRNCKAWVTQHRQNGLSHFGWTDITVDPPTPEAQFCAVRGQSTNDKSTYLERIASELVSSTEALACEERERPMENHDQTRIYLNVIVTTAVLQFAAFSAESLNLADGLLSPDTNFQELPSVRVRKQFSMRKLRLTEDDWFYSDKVDSKREDTVFVVSARHFIEFLNSLDVSKVNTG